MRRPAFTLVYKTVLAFTSILCRVSRSAVNELAGTSLFQIFLGSPFVP